MIELKNDRFIDIKTNNEFRLGCPTCDYGSEYITELTLVFEKHKDISIQIIKEYNYADYSYGDLMKLMLKEHKNLTGKSVYYLRDFFIKDIKEKLNNRVEVVVK